LINKIYLRYARNIYCIKYSNRTENIIFNFNKIGSIKLQGMLIALELISKLNKQFNRNYDLKK